MVITEDATITSGGRVTIPKRVREELDLEDGERLRFTVTDDGALAVRRATEETDRLREVRDRLAPLEVDLEDLHRESSREWERVAGDPGGGEAGFEWAGGEGELRGVD